MHGAWQCVLDNVRQVRCCLVLVSSHPWHEDTDLDVLSAVQEGDGVVVSLLGVVSYGRLAQHIGRAADCSPNPI